MDSRTGARIQAGVGYGGSCFRRDLLTLDRLAAAGDVKVDLLRVVTEVNYRQRLLPLTVLRRRFGGSLAGLRVGVLGLPFKPGTDDVRDAPALELVCALAGEGAVVTAHDPRAMEAARPYLPAQVWLADSVGQAAESTQALVLMTEWEEIVNADWEDVARRMARPRLVFDGRNALDPAVMRRLGFEYLAVGRSPADRDGTGSEVQDGR
jgi:UDPglucose 6-dehydrogenase